MNDTAHVTIRTTLLPGDLEKVIALHRTVYAEEYGYGTGFETHVIEGIHEFNEQYDVQRDRVWVCEAAGEIVGFLLLMHRGAETAQLRYFILDPAYRGKGIGGQLMVLFKAFMKEAGYTHAYLWTTSELRAAASLYGKHGFRLTEEKATSSFGKGVMEQRYDMFL